ncbi:HsdM family class I SAM-dependent methyltransferase [Xanthocytophaga agilis]|uniref:site-specific DNA-methyltransferase (adenine-specific) n=1 Tax=Xanthocytophaga agilis TaxID=3048010 RepID=A0AAE3UBR5_9BACT|nr:N-6 DNA methylase [Xanthocytophaga agilis]MDJ1500098.1 N-6 DNA methylase [Xanthocytophaga agilis]
MNKDFIVSLTKYYRKFRDKDKSSEIFVHFLAVLALKFIQETHEKPYFKDLKASTIKSIFSIWNNLSQTGTASRLDNIIEILQEENSEIFSKLFQSVFFRKLSFSDTDVDRDTKLVQLLEDLEGISFGNTLKAVEENGSSVGYLIEKFTEESFHKEGFLYTPRSIANMMAQMANLESAHSVYDPAAGIGTLLVQAAKVGKLADTSLFGQDIQSPYVELARFHLFFNGIFNASLEVGDSLSKTRSSKRTYDCVLTQPPFREKLLLPANPRDFLQPIKRRKRNLSFAAENNVTGPVRMRRQAEHLDFLTQAMDSLNETGKAILIVPHGLLFKTGVAYQIRRKMVNNNLVEAVVDLPPHVFYSSKINAAILVLNKNKTHDNILFIDASSLYDSDRRRNKIRTSHSKQVMDAFRKFATQEGLSYRASQSEIENERNNYNLTAKRYVQAHERIPDVNLKELMNEIESLEKTLSNIQDRIKTEMASLVK